MSMFSMEKRYRNKIIIIITLLHISSVHQSQCYKFLVCTSHIATNF